MLHRKRPAPRLGFAPPAPLPAPDIQGHVFFEGSNIWFGSYGQGPAVILLHGALGNGDDWANQLPSLRADGFRVVLIDSRGRGRSSFGGPPLSYELMAQEIVAVMDRLAIGQAAVAGWSDGAIISLLLAYHAPDRIDRAFAYAGNMDLQGVRETIGESPALEQSFLKAQSDFARLSPTPGAFDAMRLRMEALMTSQPNYPAAALARISRPVTIVHGEFDEFIKREHAEYLAATIPEAQLVVLPGVSHFAPWQDPQTFNARLLACLNASL